MTKKSAAVSYIGFPYQDARSIDSIMELATVENCRRFPEKASLGPYRYGKPWGAERVNRVRLADEWESADTLDCDDLGPGRAAELRLTGEDPGARAIALWIPAIQSWHIVVERSDGTREDPSVALHESSARVLGGVYQPDPETWALKIQDREGERDIMYTPSRVQWDIGDIWDHASRVLAGFAPYGAKVLPVVAAYHPSLAIALAAVSPDPQYPPTSVHGVVWRETKKGQV